MGAPTDILVQNLNDLLVSLELPITVETPYDLTPSLLLAILESMLRGRLPISTTTRDSQTASAKVEVMKVFLGVLEDDVLQADIGLSEIDPRRLAAGEWEEVVFVGETLCWLGHRLERMHHEFISQAAHPETYSSGDSRTSASADTCFSGCDVSETTATTLDEPSAQIQQSLNAAPRCIHEFDITSSFEAQSSGSVLYDFSLNDEASEHEDTPPEYAPPPRVRYHGLIQMVRDDIEDFESWHKRTKISPAALTPTRTTLGRPEAALHNLTRYTSPMQYTASLLNERARLLEELAKLKFTGLQDS